MPARADPGFGRPLGILGGAGTIRLWSETLRSMLPGGAAAPLMAMTVKKSPNRSSTPFEGSISYSFRVSAGGVRSQELEAVCFGGRTLSPEGTVWNSPP